MIGPGCEKDKLNHSNCGDLDQRRNWSKSKSGRKGKYLCQRLRVNPRPGRGREAGRVGRGGSRGLREVSTPLSLSVGGVGGQQGGHLHLSPSLGRKEGEHTLSRPLGHPATQYSDGDDSNDRLDHNEDDQCNDCVEHLMDQIYIQI